MIKKRPEDPPPPSTPAVQLPDADSFRGVETKRCSGCKKMGKLGEFGDFSYNKRYVRSEDRWVRTPAPRCNDCHAKRAAAAREKLEAEGVLAERKRQWNANRDREKQRAYSRQHAAMKRREAGIPPRNFRKRRKEEDLRVPAEPLLSFIGERYTWSEVELRGGCNRSTLREAQLRGWLYVSTVDNVLIGLDQTGWMHVLYPPGKTGTL